MLSLILASNSPRRKQLLDLTGWEYQVLAAPVDESVRPYEPPVEYVERLALEKAQAVRRLIPPDHQPRTTVVAADTTVVDPAGSAGANSLILGKPSSAAQAEAMLRQLRGRMHEVYTGLAVLPPADDVVLTQVVRTEVHLRDYSDAEIADYVASGDPLDKAGAYAIQHADFHPVQNLQGCYANVMGLPVCHLVRMLATLGLRPRNAVAEACQTTIDQPCQVFQHVLQIQ